MRFLISLSILLTLFSCVKKEESADPQSVSVTGAGSTNFGKVKVGEHRVAGVQIKNPTSDPISYTVSGIAPPFTIDGVQGDCSLTTVNAGATCIVKIRFAPVLQTESFMTLIVLGQTIAFQGKGLMPGRLSLGLSSWNAGSFRAGQQRTINIPVSNIGDTNLSIPQVVNAGFQIIAQNCGTEIVPGESCQISVAVQKAIAQDYLETLQFYTIDSATLYDMDFIATVTPGEPSGNIEFPPGLPTAIEAGAVGVFPVNTMPIRDAFGNVVSDGETVIATNLNIDIVGSTSATTLSGIVTFNLRPTGFTGASRLILSSNLASGIHNMTTVSGPPNEPITLPTRFSDMRIPADNLSTLTIVTNVMMRNGNVVTNGTLLDVTLTGPGVIETAPSNMTTVNGVLSLRIRATTVAGAATLHIGADPVTVGGVTTYGAEGTFVINFEPLQAIGNFDIASDYPSIYFLKNGSGRVDETDVAIVNIRDANNNPVGAGFTANISVLNGAHAITNLNSFNMSTDASSTLSFPVKGIGSRDWITVRVSINGTAKTHRIFATGEQQILHNKGTTNKITLKEQRGDSRFNINSMAPSSNTWKDVEVDYYGIRSLDNTNFGFQKSFGRWKEIAGPFRHLIWDCLIPVGSYLGTPPCEEKGKDGPLFIYRSYSIHEIKTERTPETFINGNIPVLPSGNSAFGEHILGPISAYDKIENKFHIFGGVAPVEVSVLVGSNWVNRYQFEAVDSGITYGDITLMAYTPFAYSSYDQEIAFPVAPSYYRYKDEVYVFGGIKKALPGILAGGIVQHFKDGNLTNITVGPGPDGSPVARYQNGVYLEEDTNELFIFGGRNSNGDFLDEIWKTDLDNVTKTWVKVCNLCDLPNNTVNNVSAIVSMLTVPVTMAAWQAVFEPMRPPVIVKDNKTKKTFYTMPYTPVLSEIDFTTGVVLEESLEDEFQEFRSFGQLVQHHTMDRFYRHDIVQVATTNTKLYYKDGDKGDMVYYKAEITVDEEARLYAQDLIPVVSAYSANTTTRSPTTVTEYGVQVYLWDYTLSRWTLVGQNTHSSPGMIATDAFSIKPVISANPGRYFNPADNKVHVLIKPRHEIGFQLDSVPASGASNLLINLIQLNGVF